MQGYALCVPGVSCHAPPDPPPAYVAAGPCRPQLLPLPCRSVQRYRPTAATARAPQAPRQPPPHHAPSRRPRPQAPPKARPPPPKSSTCLSDTANSPHGAAPSRPVMLLAGRLRPNTTSGVPAGQGPLAPPPPSPPTPPPPSPDPDPDPKQHSTPSQVQMEVLVSQPWRRRQPGPPHAVYSWPRAWGGRQEVWRGRGRGREMVWWLKRERGTAVGHVGLPQCSACGFNKGWSASLLGGHVRSHLPHSALQPQG